MSTFETLDNVVNNIEPYAAAGLVAGGLSSLTGVGATYGVPLYLMSSGAGTLIDGYQFARDLYKSATDPDAESFYQSPHFGDALLNGVELGLDLWGAKAASQLAKSNKTAKLRTPKQVPSGKVKPKGHTGHAVVMANRENARREAARRYATKYNKALEEARKTLLTRGVSNPESDYYKKRLIEEMAKKGFGIGALEVALALTKAQKTGKWLSYLSLSPFNIYDMLEGSPTEKYQEGGSLLFSSLKDVTPSYRIPLYQDASYFEAPLYLETPSIRQEVKLNYDKAYTKDNLEVLPIKPKKVKIEKDKKESSDLNLRALEVYNYILNGGTFYSPTKGTVTWGKNLYKGLCSTGSWNILWRLGLPKISNNLNVDQSGDTLRLMGMKYIGTFNPKNPKGYTPQNGDTAVWRTFTRDNGKRTLHLATYLNGKWFSDTEQNRLSCYSDKNEPDVMIYRI